MITMNLREAIQLQSVYGPATGAYRLVADLGQARDSVLAFLCAPLPQCGPFYIQDDNGEPGLFDPNSRKPIDLTYREDAEAWCRANDPGIYSVTTIKPRWARWKA